MIRPLLDSPGFDDFLVSSFRFIVLSAFLVQEGDVLKRVERVRVITANLAYFDGQDLIEQFLRFVVLLQTDQRGPQAAEACKDIRVIDAELAAKRIAHLSIQSFGLPGPTAQN